ncbi:leucine-rich repeat-containing protein 75B-like [Carcharodon carcharias]|uniref:leucine-rich repeat-containing protein 75B-like n=1 Tax=Carcharodon carcharias TaxID=13397 RepID=UPI001B7D96DE|nr:leucine-rich repeat-containing protein 75B-like [Carcharodon carcharias]
MGSKLTRGGGGGGVSGLSPQEECPRSASVQEFSSVSPAARHTVPPVSRERRVDFPLASLILKPERLSFQKTAPAPYVRRVGWIREIQALLREQRAEQAVGLLRLLRKDLGLEGTSLNDVLYKHTAFPNLVDPISHDLLMSLVHDIQCPKKELEPLKSSEKLCRQLIYHLTPHSKWHRQTISRHKSQACLKAALQKNLTNDSLNLSGMPLSPRDIHRVAYYLQLNGDHLTSIDLSFTELSDDGLHLLLPFLAALPKLTNLALNGNRLTRLILKEMTEMMKEPNKYPALSWIDLGNNADICSMPQPLLVGLRRRCSLQGALPTIQEYTEGQSNDQEMEQEEGVNQSEEDEDSPWPILQREMGAQGYCQR